MVTNEVLESYVQWEEGLISSQVFSSQEVYELELERVFGRSWLFLAHDSQIPRPGDFFSTFMGADPVMIVRQRDGSAAAFLNACRHRGMKVCRADEGNAKAFTCTYHGWSYDTAGRLISVPSQEDVYGGGLERTLWGLVPVARLENYKGLWFGSFDSSIVPLAQYLGPFKGYFDTFFDTVEGGIEFVGGTQKAAMGGNWKFAAEQFAGDSYHAVSSHMSDIMVTTPPDLSPLKSLSSPGGSSPGGSSPDGPPPSPLAGFHHFGSLDGHGAGYNSMRSTRRFASAGGADVIDRYEDSIEAEVIARHGAEFGTVYRGPVLHATVFPNLSFLANPTSIRVWHPKGPNAMEMYNWVYVDKNAPAEVKNEQRWIAQHHFGPQGLAEQDDGENFALIADNLGIRGSQISKMKLNYRMGLSDGGSTKQPAEGGVQDGMGEMPQRLFYRRWLELMTSDDQPADGA